MIDSEILLPYEKEECLKNAMEISRAYAGSGENKHGHVADFMESIYRKLVDLRTEIKSGILTEHNKGE